MSQMVWVVWMFVVCGLVIVHTPFGRAELVSTPAAMASGGADAPATIQGSEPEVSSDLEPSDPSTGAARIESALTLDTGTAHIFSTPSAGSFGRGQYYKRCSEPDHGRDCCREIDAWS